MHKTRDLTRRWRKGDGEKLAALEIEAQSAWPGGGGWTTTAEESERDIRESDLLGAFVTEDGDRMVSICTIRAKPGQKGSAYIPYLNCHPGYHGQKHGKSVIWAAVACAVEAGFRMVDINTWPANLKAVPLYKKMGFMWRPDSSVLLENFTPTARRHPIGKPFFSKNDWYDTQVRSLELKEDLVLRDKVRVYEYLWRSESGESLRMVFDRQSWEPVEIETERLLVSAAVPAERLIAGVPHPVLWKVVNKAREPIAVEVSAKGDPGVDVKLREKLTVVDAEELESSLTIDPGIKEKEKEPTAALLKTEFVVDGVRIPLANGFHVQQAVDISADASPRSVLRMGRGQRAVLNVRSNLDKPSVVHLNVHAEEGATLRKRTFKVALGAKAGSEVEVPLAAADPGRVTLNVRARASGGKRAVPVKTKRVDLLATEWDGVHGMVGDEHALLYADGLVLSASLRHGRVAVYQWLRGETAERVQLRPPSLGVPFSWEDFFQEKAAASVKATAGGVVLKLRSKSILRPGVVLERQIQIGRGALIEVTDRITNGSGRNHDVVLNHPWGMWVAPGAEFVVPTRRGVVKQSGRAGGREFDALQLSDDPDDWPEKWMCVQTDDGSAAGVIWHGASRIHAGRWGSLHLPIGRLAPGESRVLEPVRIFVGEGNWKTVQGWWRMSAGEDIPVQGDASSTTEPPIRVHLNSNPLVVHNNGSRSGTRAQIRIESVGKVKLKGEVRVEVSPGIKSARSRFPVAGVDGQRPFQKDVTLKPSSRRGGASSLSLAFETEEAVYRSSGSVWVLPHRPKQVKVDEDGDLCTVDNGILRVGVAAGFGGSVVSLKRGRREFLKSSYPNPGMRGWVNPWHGGIEPLYSRMWGTLHKERFRSRVVKRLGDQGLEWKGVDVSCRIRHERARGQTIGYTYLLTPGVDVLALLIRVKDVSGQRSNAELTFNVYPSFADRPGGGIIVNTGERGITGLAAPHWANGGNWNWGGIEGSNGSSLYLSASGEHARAGGHSDGPDGCKLWGEIGSPLEPGETLERLFFLVPSTSTGVADTHAIWQEFDRLP